MTRLLALDGLPASDSLWRIEVAVECASFLAKHGGQLVQE
jgi:hypothetical protein